MDYKLRIRKIKLFIPQPCWNYCGRKKISCNSNSAVKRRWRHRVVVRLFHRRFLGGGGHGKKRGDGFYSLGKVVEC